MNTRICDILGSNIVESIVNGMLIVSFTRWLMKFLYAVIISILKQH